MDEEDSRALFARVALPHLDAAWRFARWLVHEPVAAEDLTQEAMLKALARIGDFRGGDGRAWLLKIVRNTALDQARLCRRRPEVPLEAEDGAPHAAIASTGPTPEDEMLGGERRTWLRAQVDALPDDLREALLLREFEELSYREIAEVLGVPIGTVMSRLFRARQLLMDGRVKETET